MRNKFLVFSIFLITLCNISYAQNSIYVNGTVGNFVYHYDNSLPITQDKNLNYGFGTNIGVIHNLNTEYKLILETGYYFSKASDVSTVTYFTQFDALKYDFDLTQYSFPFDITISKNLLEHFDVGLGLSFEGINHTITTNQPFNREPLEDKINLFALGANGLVQFRLPFADDGRISILSNLRLRYLYSVWKIGGERKLNDYNFNFLQSNFSIGICYNL
ncbi:MAG: hypothetical protein IPH62_00240 [Ignavibacteriae bacterium]|nr:hypothetical protein [Ignavibacteriota bacterium]